MLLHAERHGHRRLFVSLDLSDDVQVPLPPSLQPYTPKVKAIPPHKSKHRPIARGTCPAFTHSPRLVHLLCPMQSLSPGKPEVKSSEADLPLPPLVPRATSLTRALSSDKSMCVQTR